MSFQLSVLLSVIFSCQIGHRDEYTCTHTYQWYMLLLLPLTELLFTRRAHRRSPAHHARAMGAAPLPRKNKNASDTSVVVVDEVSSDINSVYVYPSRKSLDAQYMVQAQPNMHTNIGISIKINYCRKRLETTNTSTDGQEQQILQKHYQNKEREQTSHSLTIQLCYPSSAMNWQGVGAALAARANPAHRTPRVPGDELAAFWTNSVRLCAWLYLWMSVGLIGKGFRHSEPIRAM